MSSEDHGIPLLPLRPAALAFPTDDAGFDLIRGIVAYAQARYGMTLAQAVGHLNDKLGARDGRPPIAVTVDGFWFRDPLEHVARQLFEGTYWVRRNDAAPDSLD
jgi:hypothetical protein